jgi:hypothetical protein
MMSASTTSSSVEDLSEKPQLQEEESPNDVILSESVDGLVGEDRSEIACHLVENLLSNVIELAIKESENNYHEIPLTATFTDSLLENSEEALEVPKENETATEEEDHEQISGYNNLNLNINLSEDKNTNSEVFSPVVPTIYVTEVHQYEANGLEKFNEAFDTYTKTIQNSKGKKEKNLPLYEDYASVVISEIWTEVSKSVLPVHFEISKPSSPLEISCSKNKSIGNDGDEGFCEEVSHGEVIENHHETKCVRDRVFAIESEQDDEDIIVETGVAIDSLITSQEIFEKKDNTFDINSNDRVIEHSEHNIKKTNNTSEQGDVIAIVEEEGNSEEERKEKEEENSEENSDRKISDEVGDGFDNDDRIRICQNDEDMIEESLASLHEQTMVEEASIKSIHDECGDLQQMIIQRSRDLIMATAEGQSASSLSQYLGKKIKMI